MFLVMKMDKTYICIDLKSFYASVECRERGLDPLNTNLVVADMGRTEKTICLAVSPSLKQYGISGRARMFEVIQKVKNVNYERRKKINYKRFIDKSYLDQELKKNCYLELDYIVAPPQMKKYMKYSANIYNVYLKYLSSEDILVYSIDEVFCDVTSYLNTYKITATELVSKMIQDVYNNTGITATAGIGSNMYLCKVAMDIVAKHKEPNEIGVRIAELDEMNYRKKLWNHKPITDFWRVGAGYAKKLESKGLSTMGEIARCSISNEELLYKMFGINAEFLIDHAWGYEPTTITQAKTYKPKTNSLSSGQVLHCPYDYIKAKLIVKEMTDSLSLDLVEKKLVTNQLTLTIQYDIDNLKIPSIRANYKGEITTDHLGRKIPKHSHGTINLEYHTSSTKLIIDAIINLYDRIINPKLLVRKINISVNNLIDESMVVGKQRYKQLDLFKDNFKNINAKEIREEEEEEKKVQLAMLKIKNKYGKNAILKGMNLEEGATAKDRNEQVGGHKG